MVSPLFCITLNHIIAFMYRFAITFFSRSHSLINRDVDQVGYSFLSFLKEIGHTYRIAISRIIERRARAFFFFFFTSEVSALCVNFRVRSYKCIIRFPYACFRSMRYSLVAFVLSFPAGKRVKKNIDLFAYFPIRDKISKESQFYLQRQHPVFRFNFPLFPIPHSLH